MSKTYYIEIDGERIPVPKAVYYEYMRPAWRETKRKKVRAKRERSLEVFEQDGFLVPSNDPLVDEIVTDKLLLEMLMSALSKLTDNERSLIDALYFEEKTERDVANRMGISQSTVQRFL